MLFHTFYFPFFSFLQAHDGKALCVDWVAGGDKGERVVKIASGGSDCLVRTTQLGEPEEEK